MRFIKLTVTALAMAMLVSACGKSASNATQSTEELEAQIESLQAQLAEAQQEQPVEEKNDSNEDDGAEHIVDPEKYENGDVNENVEESFECLEEMKNTTLEQGYIQVDDIIIRMGDVMTIDEVYQMFNEKNRYEIKCSTELLNGIKHGLDRDTKLYDYMPDAPAINAFGYLVIFKDSNLYAVVEAVDTEKNLSSANVLSNLYVWKVFYYGAAKNNVWYAHGLPATGGEEFSVTGFLKEQKMEMREKGRFDFETPFNNGTSLSVKMDNVEGYGTPKIIYAFEYDPTLDQITSVEIH